MEYKKQKYERIVNEVIGRSDIVLIVLDARNVSYSMNQKIEYMVRKHGRKALYVVNKIDLVTKEEQDKIDIPNSVHISAKRHVGTMRLLRKISEIAKRREVTVGIVGFPNTGKSTIINALKGKHSAPTSCVSGFTKGLQRVRITGKILMIDTPGVFSYEGEGSHNNLMIGSVDYENVDDPEMAALELIEKLGGKIEQFYGVKRSEDATATLEDIASKKNFLKKGGLPDTVRMGKEIIKQCQAGKIRQIL